MATPDEIRESELGTKAKILGCCLRRSHPLACGPLTTAACGFMKRPIARGNFTVSKTSIKLRTSL